MCLFQSSSGLDHQFTPRPRSGTFTTGNLRNEPRRRDQDPPPVTSHIRTRRSGTGSVPGCVRRAAAADAASDQMANSRKTSSCTTYRELQTSEARGQFSCLLCLEPSFSTSPRHLDCRHAFCDRCLADYRRLYSITSADDDAVSSRSRRLVACPTCRHVTRLSSSHGAPVAPLPISSTGNGSSGDSMRTRKMSQAMVDATHRCDACLCRKRIEPADFYCSKCLLNFCNDCKSAHDAQTLFSTHSVIHITNKVHQHFRHSLSFHYHLRSGVVCSSVASVCMSVSVCDNLRKPSRRNFSSFGLRVHLHGITVKLIYEGHRVEKDEAHSGKKREILYSPSVKLKSAITPVV